MNARMRMGWALGLGLGVFGCSQEAPPPTPAPAPAPMVAAPPAAPAYTVGQAVQVEWRGSWYAAHILAVEPAGTYRIHYDGWSDSWDESVPPARIRVGGAPAAAPPPEATAPAAPAPAAPGTCPDPAGTVPNSGGTADPGGTQPPSAAAVAPCTALQVSWNNKWYHAVALAANPDGTLRIHYPGWAASWDENAVLTRVRVGGTIRP